MAKTITQNEFEELKAKASKPIVLEFGADGWGACQMLRPVVSSVAEQMDTVDFYHVDVNKSSDLANEFGVQSIPTMVLLKDGKEADRTSGFAPEEQVKAFAEG